MPDPIAYFESTDTVHIATALKSGAEVVTPIWSVVVDGVPYIRNGFGASSKWHRRAQRAGGAAVFVDGSDRYPVRLVEETDASVLDAVDRAYEAKYASYGSSLQSVLTPSVRASTIRLIVE
ncbi:DUF2255 family protein [Amnibacterium flavum]|uniref:DUF2255 domain-containing protein n=1 Tax=Amnibacterium flavum TaxID=2173173 RepID=A0A2V1HV20_9MICO|nr:DUF2255 family protein [Amnibacterium flavum]PVZ94859.1 hypothetical protein DDQ50_08845 [Amnibacterium flavum]